VTRPQCVQSGADEWLDFLECRRESVALDFEVVASLEVQPKSLGGPEVPREAQRRVGADPTLAVDDLVDPTRWDSDRDGQLVLGDPERLQVLLDEYLARVDGGA